MKFKIINTKKVLFMVFPAVFKFAYILTLGKLRLRKPPRLNLKQIDTKNLEEGVGKAIN